MLTNPYSKKWLTVKGGHGSLISETHAAKFAKAFEEAFSQAEDDAGLTGPAK